MKNTSPFTPLIPWFEATKRPLPWRNQGATPYAVWVSEVMLQQTQVKVVIPYFNKWMSTFPTVKTLAEAPIEKVIKTWEGLGYYSRARNLHSGAQHIIKHFGGEIPSEESKLKEIKGLGPYTIGAIRSFAFKEKAAAVDGNVIRVLSRFFNITDDVSKSKTQKELRSLVFSSLPEEKPWVVSEALIELGATICKKKPLCNQCPLQKSCKAFSAKTHEELPYSSAKIEYIPLYRGVAVIQHEGHILLMKGKKGEIMNDLYEFPYFDATSPDISSRAVSEELFNRWNIPLIEEKILKPVKQSFTRYRVLLVPYLFKTKKKCDINACIWYCKDDLEKLPFSSGHRRILKQIR